MARDHSSTSRPALPLLGVALLLAGVSLAAAPPGGALQEQRADADLVDTTLVALRERRLSPSEAADALTASAGAASLFEGLARGTLRVRQSDRSYTSTRMSAAERAVLVDALGRLPWDGVALALEARRSATSDLPTRVAAIEVLGALGRTEDLCTLLSWAELDGKSVRVAPEVRAALTSGLDELAGRWPEALCDLAEAASSLNRSLFTPVLQGLAHSPSARRLASLGELLSGIPALDAYVLAEIGHMAQSAHVVPEAATRERVRRYLDNPDPVLALEAAAAAGHLRDREAIPGLIGLLDPSNRVVARRAHEALVEITGQQIAITPTPWLEWHAAVSEWWQDEAQERVDVAVSGAPGAASLALQELAKLRLYRDELAPALAPCLQRDEVELVLLACASLGHLGSPAAVTPLLDTLTDPNVDVRRAAYLALRRISGEDHGDDPAAWRARGW